MAKTARRTWQLAEGRAAALFGAKRQPGSGSGGREDQTCSDSVHPRVYLEHKMRASHAVLTLWRETDRKAEREKKVPVVALSEKGRHGHWLLVHSSDLDWLIVERLAALPSDDLDKIQQRVWATRELDAEG